MKIQRLKNLLFLLAMILLSGQIYAQSMASLKRDIMDIIKSKKAVVGVAINGTNPSDTLSILGDGRFPMQSVFKFPIALMVLSEIDKGNLSLDQKVNISKDDLIPEIWSPIREKYPNGIVLSISEILQYTVSLSDNIGCDVLLRLVGGPQSVENYFSTLGFKDIAIKINEETMQSNWDLQFQNWITPKESNAILLAFYRNADHFLSSKSYEFIWETMESTKTGENRLRGQLPEHTVVAHKTGWSGVHKVTGISAAVNDVGLVFLPNGDFFAISVFVTDSQEETSVNERIISDISKLAWDHFNK